MIIIEGVDRVGKSTLARALARRLPDYRVVHCGVPPEGTHVDSYHRSVIGGDSKLIVDRLHWSEFAYGETYRHGCAYTIAQWYSLESELLERGARVILMSDAVKLIQSRWVGEQFDVAGLVRLNGAFFDLFYDRATRVSRLPRVNFNWRDFFNPDDSERDRNSLDTLAEYAVGGASAT